MDAVSLREASIAGRKIRSLDAERAIRCPAAGPMMSPMALLVVEPKTELSVKRVPIEVPNHSCDR
jgi:hypothetical protein